MHRNVLFVMAVLGVCLAFGLSVPSAQKPGGVAAPGFAGPGSGGGGPIGGIGAGGRGGGATTTAPVMLMGFTTQLFPMGVGPMILSRACQEERPNSRLCEWRDIFSAVPPIGLDREVLVAANFDTRPMPMCLNPAGGTRCNTSITMRPAACCGFPAPPEIPSPAALDLAPSDPQTLTSCGDTFAFTVTATDADGKPMEGALVSFSIVPLVGGTGNIFGNFSPAAGATDASGQLSTVLTLITSSCESACTGAGQDCLTGIQALSHGPVFSNIVNLVDGIQ
jgi:hypothetical protein